MTEATLVLGLLATVLAAVVAAVLLRRRPARPARRAGTLPADPRPVRAAGSKQPPPVAASPASSARAAEGGRIKGRVRASSKRAVGDIVAQHPDEAISVLRRWIKSGDRPDGK
jgi:flagellar biosynthesis/type III secretory pathway M-ring protein FliF/YscJ